MKNNILIFRSESHEIYYKNVWNTIWIIMIMSIMVKSTKFNLI